VSLDAKDIPLALVQQDDSPLAHDLAASFGFSRFFEVRRSQDAPSAQRDLVAGRFYAVLVIPRDFSAALARRDTQATLQLITDGSETNSASVVENYIQGVLATWLEARATELGLNVQAPPRLVSRVFYNPALNSRYSLVPGSLAIIMAIIGTLLTALVVAREWERGTMEALLATPLGVLEIILGKLIPYFLLGLGSMFMSTMIAVLLFHVPYRGSIPALALVSACFLLCALGQGLLISTLSRNQFVAAQMALITAFLPAFLLSGFIFEIASMPWPIQQITRIVPARYLVGCLQTLFLVGDHWPLLVPKIGVMLLIAGVFYGIVAKKTSRRLC
jgi:ABC-2 type transport system permease protein